MSHTYNINKKLQSYWTMTGENILSETNNIITKSITTNKELLKFQFTESKDATKFISLIADDITETINFHSICGFLQCVGVNESVRKSSFMADLTMSKYINELNMNKDIYNKLLEFQQIILNGKDELDKKFISKLIKSYERNGINLNDNKRELLLRIRHEISKLENAIIKCMSENENKTIEFRHNDLDGIPNNILQTFKCNNKTYSINLNKTNYTTLMKYLNDSDLRKKVETLYSTKYDNLINYISKLIVLRDKHAKLLSYNCHSDYKAEQQMTKTSDNIKSFLTELLQKLDFRYMKELDTMHKIAKKYTHNNQIHTSDIQYLSAKWKQEYGINDQIIREYFPLDSVITQIFNIYQTLFDIKFEKVNNTNCWHDQVITYDILSKGEIIGHLYFDIFSRPGKYKQTRCFSLQSTCWYPYASSKYQIPTIALVTSFDKNNNGLTLLHFHEVVSLFHEIGHVMHHIYGKSKYIMFSGTNVELDFIETPAQVLDLLCWEKHIIRQLSLHYKTKTQLPDNIIDKLIKLKNLDIGLHYKKHILISLFDQILYSSGTFTGLCEDLLKEGDVVNIKKLLTGIYEQLHDEIMVNTNKDEKYKIILNESAILPIEWINSIHGSDAQYYCSIWSRVLSSDLYNEKIKGKPLNKKIGDELKQHILGFGGTKTAYDMICDYMHRKPLVDGFINMHNLDTDMEYSFFLNTEQIKKNDTVTPQTNNSRIYYPIEKHYEYEHEIDSVSNRYSEIYESSVNINDFE